MVDEIEADHQPHARWVGDIAKHIGRELRLAYDSKEEHANAQKVLEKGRCY